MYIRTDVTCCFQFQGVKNDGSEDKTRTAGKWKVGAGTAYQRMSSDLKRLGGAELAYPKVGRKGELTLLSAAILTDNIILLYVCAPFPKVYTAV